MVINREFFFRGWLPAGLVLNARLLTQAAGPVPGKEYDEYPVMRPMFNADPGRGWQPNQPAPVFPVEQANDDTAIILKDSISEGTLVMLPLGEWLGSGSPMILALNTWYEGRVQEVTGSDVMAIRLHAVPNAQYYSTKSTPTASDVADVSVTNLVCRWLTGKSANVALFQDPTNITATREVGLPPTVTLAGETIPCRVMEYFSLTHASVAGLPRAWESTDPNSDRCYIQCAITDWASVDPSRDPTPINKFGVIPVAQTVLQNFYTVLYDAISSVEIMKNILNPEGEFVWAVARNSASDDQVVHYN